MLKVGILSDTHGFVPPQLYRFFDECDEIWHAGDWGDPEIFFQMQQFKPLKTVWGNIDGSVIRHEMPEVLCFKAEELKVLMLHIGGYPGKYSPKCLQLIKEQKPDIMVCGHSHILKVMRDKQFNLMHFNPGAAGYKGFHTQCTALRLHIDQSKLSNLEVWEMSRTQLLTSNG
jgi:putative phosphoesterase